MEIVQALATVVAAVIVAIVGPIIYRNYITRPKQDALTFGKKVGIRACDGRYVMADLNTNSRLLGREHHLKEWEMFEIVDALDPFSSVPKPIRYGDKVALRAINNGSFVGAALDSNGELFARVSWVKAWETFVLCRTPSSVRVGVDNIVRYGSFFALQAHNGKNVMFNREGDGGLSAVALHIKEWETFVFIDPAQPK
jgi:hypothetical protein